ncbi:MAG: 6-carboxytetrahydropterin synthase QueD [bacterium]|nr:6-carboxytetrahydropterin synthase QueD [bacterium]
MFEITVRDDFSAAHRLKDYPGECENVHGHNWLVEVFVRCERLNEIGITIDFCQVKQSLGAILGELDHKDLNHIPPFDKENPSSENIARYVYHAMRDAVNTSDVRVSKVTVYETPSASASYWED